jgi:hypothetical protein
MEALSGENGRTNTFTKDVINVDSIMVIVELLNYNYMRYITTSEWNKSYQLDHLSPSSSWRLKYCLVLQAECILLLTCWLDFDSDACNAMLF